VRVRVLNPDDRLRPEMGVRVVIDPPPSLATGDGVSVVE
jgi:hypothetical protein